MIVEETAIPDVPLQYRLIEATDLAFVINSWLLSYRKQMGFKGVERERYFEGQLALINYLAQYAKVLVACDAKQPMYIVGWGCAHVDKEGAFGLHYVYVKEDYRRHGIAKGIVNRLGYRDGRPIMTSHWNHNARAYSLTHPLLQYNPYLITLGYKYV